METKADHSSEIKRINRMIGQLEGIKRMIIEGTYCPEILIQTKAVTSAIRGLEIALLDSHINCCVRNAFMTRNQEDEKIEELLKIFKTRIK